MQDSGREAISFPTLKLLIEKIREEPLAPETTEVILGTKWRVFKFGIPLPRRPAYLDKESAAPVFLVTSVHFSQQGVVEAREVDEFVEKNRRALFRHSVVLASAEGFTAGALAAFRRGKTLDYLSETHWPRLWPKTGAP